MKVIQTQLPGVLIFEPTIHRDERGFFVETFRADTHARHAQVHLPFVQDNHCRSRMGVLRGLHVQKQYAQGKLARVLRGAVFDVAVDIDPMSNTYSQWIGVTLSDSNHRILWIPPGYAHGFLVLSEIADFEYKCTEYYHPEDQIGVIWNDPEIGIVWPLERPILSAKDRHLPRLRALMRRKGA